MTKPGASAPRTDIPAAGRYRLDPGRCSVTFRTRHLFGLAGVSGTMDVTEGAIAVEPEIPHATVTVSISAASLTTGNRRRDRDVRSAKFLNALQYPDITFRAGAISQTHGRWTLVGELRVGEISSPATLTIASIEKSGAGFLARATTRVDRYALGVTAAKGLAARYLHIDLTAVATPQ